MKPYSEYSVTVIIPTYNRAGLLTQTIDSILDQSRPPERIIVVNDGSTDETESVLQQYGSRLDYIYQTNSGKSAALNRALATIKAGHVWIMDDDDLPMTDTLERHLAYLDQNPDVDFTYSGYYQFQGERLPASQENLKFDDYPEPHRSVFFIWCMTVFPFSMGSMLVPIRCYRKTGHFDEALMRGQDYDMIIRLARHFQGGKIEDPTFYVRVHQGVRGPGHERHDANERDAVWRKYELTIFRKVRETLELREYLPRGTAKESLTGQQMRRALLQRGCIMARHGLLDEALHDLHNATDETWRGYPYSQGERLICAQMLDISPELLDWRGQYTAHVAKLIRKRAITLLGDCVKGYSWNVRREARKGNYLTVARLMANLPPLIGFTGMYSLIRSAVRSRLKTFYG